MSFESGVESAGGHSSSMEKAFILSINGIALSFYTSLPPEKIYSWEQIREALFSYFQANYAASVTIGDLFTVKQKEGKSFKGINPLFCASEVSSKGSE